MSVIVNNYNYAPYLSQAIDSALAQSYSPVEVVVVDDGSTDDSREIIAGYGNRIVPILKQNQGQTSAINAGFAACLGEIVCFLDADDLLFPTAMERAVAGFTDPAVVKVHWPLCITDREGIATGERSPAAELAEGDVREVVLREGPDACLFPPTSGNVWRRSFLECVLPLTGAEDQVGRGSASADAILSGLAPLYGRIGRIDETQGTYRQHGGNDYANLPFDERLVFDLAVHQHLCDLFAEHCRMLGISVDRSGWDRASWCCRIAQALRDIDTWVAPEEPFILVDEQDWALDTSSRYRPIPFPERDGVYWGRPAGSKDAILELERLRGKGVRFMVFAWPGFWWLDYYTEFGSYLRSRYPQVLVTDQVIVFDLCRIPSRPENVPADV